MGFTNAELVAQTLAGDREAFGELVERHRRTVYALALQRGFQPAEAEDVAQEVFIKAYTSLGALKDPGAFGSWLYGIAAHVAADAARARRRRREESGFPGAAELAAFRGEDIAPVWGGEFGSIMRALGDLSEEQRVAVTLRYLEGLSPKQIAERLGEPRGTVRSRLHHALRYLQTALTGRRMVKGTKSASASRKAPRA